MIKIVAFGVQKARKRTLKSRRTQNESLFGAENEQAEAITVNGDHYWALLNEFLFTKLEEKDIGNIWFQHDGATCHISEATLDVLRPVFEDRIISRRADAIWPHQAAI